MQQFSIQIDSVVDLLQLERDPKGSAGASFQVKCPFCSDPKYHMNINTIKNTYNCFRCGGKHTGGGALDLYGRAALGEELIPGKKEFGGNGNVLYAKLAEALGMQKGVSNIARNNVEYREVWAITPAPDEVLNSAYSALLGIKELALTDIHRSNLRKRGLDDESIERNEYRSVQAGFNWAARYRDDAAEYRRLGIGREAINYKQLRKLPGNILLGGYIVAQILKRKGVSMERVPGFFRLKGQWMFRLELGMLIPTRNRDGLIVGMQARKDYGNLRYMTISSKSLPDGVTEGISREHFPLANAPLSDKAKILITEGPLKADVATYLLDEENVLMVAIPGVNHAKNLRQIFKDARDAGVKVIYNCFDMDKVTNPNVAAASKEIRKLAKHFGLTLQIRAWDGNFAQVKWMELYGLCRCHGIATAPMPDTADDIIAEIGKMAQGLHERGIKHSHYLTKNGVVRRYWAEDTKGIDDFLLRERRIVNG